MFAWHTRLEEIVLLFSATEFPLWRQTQSCTGGPRRIQVSFTLLKDISPAQFADLPHHTVTLPQHFFIISILNCYWKSKVKAVGLWGLLKYFFDQVKITMAQYKVLDPEQEIPCPYNRCEMIRAKRMPYHLIKCRRASIV